MITVKGEASGSITSVAPLSYRYHPPTRSANNTDQVCE